MFKHQSSRRTHPGGLRYEPYVYILDYLEMGNPSDVHYEHRSQPFVQCIGTKYFSLLEATPLIGVKIEVLEKVDLSYPSKLKRIIHITYSDLTSVARANLPEAIKRIIVENENIFVEFFNIAEPINIRLHSLELLPDVGKKTMNAVLDARRQKKFTSFNDIKERVGLDPVKTIVERIVRELAGNEKYYLFIKPRDKSGLYLGYLERLYGEVFNPFEVSRKQLLQWTIRVLRDNGIKPRRKLSQNFIIDPVLLREISSYVDENSDVLEVGCGIGTLTSVILHKARTLLCIEIDQRLCEIIRWNLLSKGLIVVNGDALKIPFNRKLLVSNIPYHITTDILLKVSRENMVEKAVLTLQREVAERITAIPGSRNYGKISVLLNNLFSIREGGVYSPRSFYPRPEVYHQVIVLTRRRYYSRDFEKLELVTRVFFSQRKRLVEKILLDKFNTGLIQLGDLGRKIMGKRVFMVDPETWLALTRILSEQGVI